MEIVNLPEKEFRITVVKMIQDLRKRIQKMQEIFTNDLEELKKKQTEMKKKKIHWKESIEEQLSRIMDE